MPSYDWRCIYTRTEHLTVRKVWTTAHGRNSHTVHDQDPVSLTMIEETRTLANVPMFARTEIHDEGRGLRALLEYPVKTMNIVKEPARFQVDTGPIIVPDFESESERAIERIDIAHVVYNVFDKAEFVLRRPTEIVKGEEPLYSVTDYSVVREMPARNQILCPA